MSRLYYPPTIRGELIQGKAGDGGLDVGEATKKIAKLIPTELVTGFGALVGACMVIKWEPFRVPAIGVCFLICLVLTPIYLNRVADKDGKPKRNQVIIGTIAFPIWAYLVSGGQVIPQYYDAAVAMVFATVFSLVTAAIPMNH